MFEVCTGECFKSYLYLLPDSAVAATMAHRPGPDGHRAWCAAHGFGAIVFSNWQHVETASQRSTMTIAPSAVDVEVEMVAKHASSSRTHVLGGTSRFLRWATKHGRQYNRLPIVNNYPKGFVVDSLKIAPQVRVQFSDTRSL